MHGKCILVPELANRWDSMALRLAKRLDWLDGRPSWLFVCVLYLARWVLLAPYLVAAEYLFSNAEASGAQMSKLSEISPIVLFAMIVILSPLVETLLECSLPYFVLSFLRRKRGKLPARPWLFVMISALVMASMHPVLSAVVPSLVTGAFLAYCYGHFAVRGTGRAIVFTTIFHAGINIVGWTMIAVGVTG